MAKHNGLARLRAWAGSLDRTFMHVYGPAQVTRDEIVREPDPALAARVAAMDEAFVWQTTASGHRYLVERPD